MEKRTPKLSYAEKMKRLAYVLEFEFAHDGEEGGDKFPRAAEKILDILSGDRPWPEASLGRQNFYLR